MCSMIIIICDVTESKISNTSYFHINIFSLVYWEKSETLLSSKVCIFVPGVSKGGVGGGFSILL